MFYLSNLLSKKSRLDRPLDTLPTPVIGQLDNPQKNRTKTEQKKSPQLPLFPVWQNPIILHTTLTNQSIASILCLTPVNVVNSTTFSLSKAVLDCPVIIFHNIISTPVSLTKCSVYVGQLIFSERLPLLIGQPPQYDDRPTCPIINWGNATIENRTLMRQNVIL